MTPSDVMWFAAEITAYAAVIWWAMTRPMARLPRIALALAAVAAFAGSWGVFASPTAAHPLTGAARIAFVAVWFALAASAALAAARIHRDRMSLRRAGR